MEEISNETAQRTWRAIQLDWNFSFFKKATSKTSRHSVWVRPPGRNWHVEKVSGEERDWVNALLDEASVPK